MMIAAFLALAMLASVIPMAEAGMQEIGTEATIGTVSPGNQNYTSVPAYVNFTASITGLAANETPYINLTGTEYKMLYNSTNSDYFYNWTSNITEGIFTYWIVVRDNTTGNITGKSDNYTIMIDKTGPVITAPVSHVEGHPTVITITDAVSGVKNATITITKGNSSMYSSTINATDGRIDWSRNIGPGTYNYTIDAVDMFGNPSNATGNFTVTEDTAAPVISNVAATPLSVPQNGYINITANVSDAGVGVDTVLANITYPNGTHYTKLMMLFNGTYYYNSTYSDIGSYSFFIWANDTKNNADNSSSYSFEVTDATAPTINNYSAAAIGATRMLIVANITDNYDAADTLQVSVTVIDSSAVPVVTNVSMIYNVTLGIYTYLTDSLSIGHYTYEIYAADKAGNMAEVQGAFDIVDSVAPSITNVNVPSNIVEHQNVTITCVVQDNVDDVTNITVSISVDGTSYPMAYSGSNNVFEYTIKDVTFGNHTFVITATDSSDNTANTTAQTFFAKDSEAPELDQGNSSIPTQGTLGEKITFSVALQDDDPVTSVTLYYSVDNGNQTSVPMTLQNGKYVASITVNSGSTLNYRIVADDGQSPPTTVAQGNMKLSQKSTMSTAMLAGIGILLLIIIIAVIAVMMKKKPAEAPAEESTEEPEEESSEEVSEEESDSGEDDELGEEL